jgi:hypothetical protein
MPEKSKFLQMFESLPPEEQDKVAQIAIQMSEWIVDNKEKLKK